MVDAAVNDPSRLQRVEAIFHAVADEEDGPGRAAKIEALSGGDMQLAADVHSLLAEDEHLRGTPADVDPHLGLRLGHYEVERLIARGGMAAVYEARRADDTFQQRVAIKIMDLRLSDPALVAQFRAERQILAALEHPTITRLLDGGVTSLGEPYLVMEFVEGQPIDRYADAQRLDLPARLRLFAQVCEGVAFAHRNLVLHRDLKPANILVTADGHAKVVDFGTATLLQPDRLSTVSKAPLTPAYASPEQLIGQAVGTASDQYSLGLVLYELLAGARPFGGGSSLMAAMERAMLGAATTAPHTVATAAAATARRTSLVRLRRVLMGDLGTIVNKTLAADPTRRYASVQHLSEDLARWAAHEPILGRAPSLPYRAARFVQRHWAASALVATLLVALLVATAVSFRQAAVATRESAKATQLNRFLTEMLASASPIGTTATAARSASLTVREVLDGASQTVATTLGATPELEAETHLTLGRTYVGIGVFDRAEAELGQALRMFRQLGPPAKVASALSQLGRIQQLLGQNETAAPFLREAVSIERARGEQADAEVLTDAMNNLALTIASKRPADPEAIALLRESVAIADRRGLTSANVVAMRQALGNQLMIGGALAESETVLRDALARAELVAADHPTRLYVLRSLSELLRTLGRYDEAAKVGATAAEGAAKAWPPDYPFQFAFLVTWGRALAHTDDLERALVVLADAETRARTMRPAGHSDFATVKLSVGTALRRLGRLDQAAAAQRDALEILDRYPAIKHTRAHVLGELGLTLRAQAQGAEAERLLADSLALYRELLGETHPFTVLAQARVRGGSD